MIKITTITIVLAAAFALSGCNSTAPSTPSVAAPAAAPAQSTGWDGTWTGKWGGSSSESRIVIKGGSVVQYDFGGKSTPPGTTKVSGDSLSFGTATYSITMTKSGPNTASGHWQRGQWSSDSVFTRG